MRLDKYLARIGYGSKEIVKEFIKNSMVSVNSKLITDPSFQIGEFDNVLVDNKVKPYKKLVYIMMNKPNGVLSVTKDDTNNVVINYLSEEYRLMNLSPKGRLDIDTTGLLILTNDTKVLRRIASPNYHISKTYLVTFIGNIEYVDISLFNQGITLSNGYVTKPSKIEFINKEQALITIYEGKYHQIKRMFQSVNLKVIKLHRISIDKIYIDPSLKEGEYRLLNEEEINILKSH